MSDEADFRYEHYDGGWGKSDPEDSVVAPDDNPIEERPSGGLIGIIIRALLDGCEG